MSEQSDNVNKPAHYNKSGIECIEAIEACLSEEEFIGYLRGNILKYTWRCLHKNKAEDVAKSIWYSKVLELKLKAKENGKNNKKRN